jgi:hypothetical protein
MGRRFGIVGLALLSGGILLAGMSPGPFAATSSAPDLLSNDRSQDTERRPRQRQADRAARRGRGQATAERQSAVVGSAVVAVSHAGAPDLFGLAPPAIARGGCAFG